MEAGSYKLLESATQRSVHAAGFSRASASTTTLLTDLLARYLTLLASSAARYAQHANRTVVTPADTLSALHDLGFDLTDLKDYIAEGRELGRYAVYSGRRVEELAEMRRELQVGRAREKGEVVLEYAPLPIYDEEENDDEEEEEDEEELEPPAKRQRTLDWDGHIPSFLPPFPVIDDAPPQPDSPPAESPHPLQPPPSAPSTTAVVVPQLTATSTSAADYLLQLPYEQSSLAEVSQWHLPGAQPSASPSSSSRPTLNPAASTSATAPTTNPELALYKAFHHILRHPQREPAPSNPARHRVAMSLLQQTQVVPRWELPDTMYAGAASAGSASARAWPIVPTYAVAKDPTTPQRRFPPTHRTVAAPDRLAPLLSSQSSRLPELARGVLPPAVYARVTRLTHPQPLTRGNQQLKYGPGVAAPWNALAGAGESKNANGDDGGEGNAREKEKEKRIPDARVYATWDYETKDFKAALKKRPNPNTSAPVNTRRSSRAVA